MGSIAKANPSSAEAEIRTMLDGWVEAHRVKDADRVLSHIAEDAVQFILAPPLQYSGAKAWDKEALETWFSSFDGPMDFQIRDLTMVAGDGIAFCHYLQRMSAVAIEHGRFSLWHRVTLGLRKSGGRWLVGHRHESVPFYMDGGFKAAVDLEP